MTRKNDTDIRKKFWKGKMEISLNFLFGFLMKQAMTSFPLYTFNKVSLEIRGFETLSHHHYVCDYLF